jgi:peptidoglycan/LPS O-acetylase OafA/YrhL
MSARYRNLTLIPKAALGLSSLLSRSLLWHRDLRADIAEGRDPALHGLRGLAVLIVMASHAQFLELKGQGGFGVWLFFVLSGFLLTAPFCDRPATAYSPSALANFVKRRVMRIIPAYWAAILLLYAQFAPHPVSWAVENMTMIHGDYHLWTVRQEMILYMTLPIAMAITLLLRRFPILAAAVSLLIGALLMRYLTIPVLSFTNEEGPKPFYAFPFFVGISACWLQKSSRYLVLRDRFLKAWLCDAITIATLVVTILSAKFYTEFLFHFAGLRAPSVSYAVWRYYWVFSLLGGILVLALQSHRGRITGAVFATPPLVAVGVVGYSMYLIHPYIFRTLGYFAHIGDGDTLFALGLSATFAASCISYGFIERVFWTPRQPRKVVGAPPTADSLPVANSQF